MKTIIISGLVLAFAIACHSPLPSKPKASVSTAQSSTDTLASNASQQTSGSETSIVSDNPTVGRVKSMVNGDLMCYVTLVAENNIEYEVGATFDICANSNLFVNQKVRLFYERIPVNDCQSAEPCGKTRIESLITQMETIGGGNSENPGNSQTLSNGDWTITIGNWDSWSGVNGTGNLSYRGCDSQGNCINLTSGRVTCRDGLCTIGWRNGNYFYVIEQPMDNPDRPEISESSTRLIVRQGSEIILDATGFKIVYP
ncbi:MAG: hypothetical protein RID09_12555 [Coleofasciculus sp. G1-WW12-02]|uniref:hypothetical protein n=1 Tax=Coleofasciculus sp. G1-WW12-02 TaxID=3068483 RepID=UPI0032FB94F0